MKTFEEIQADPKFRELSPEAQGIVLERVKPGFSKLSPEAQGIVLQKLTSAPAVPNAIQGGVTKEVPLPDVNPIQGVGNIAGAIGKGLGDLAQAAVNPQTYENLGQQIGQSFATEGQNFNPSALWEIPEALGAGAVQGVRDLGQGISSLPADIANAYYGQRVFDPALNLPELPQGWRDVMARHPVAGFVGEQVPYMIPFSRAAQATRLSRLRQLGRAAAEGAAIGGLIDPKGQGMQGRVATGAMGAALPVALGAGAGAFSKTVKVGPKSAQEMVQLLRERLKQPERHIGIARVKKEVHGEVVPPGADLLPMGYKMAARQAYVKAEQAQPKFLQDLRDVAQETGLEYRPDFEQYALKGEDSIVTKYKRKGGVVPIKDSLRSTLVMPPGPERGKHLEGVIQALEKRGYKITEVTNRFDDPTPGYKDIGINYTADDGLIRELQLLQPNMLKAKFGAGHQIYDMLKEFEIVEKALGELPPGLRKHREQITTRMTQLYQESLGRDSIAPPQAVRASSISKGMPNSANVARTFSKGAPSKRLAATSASRASSSFGDTRVDISGPSNTTVAPQPQKKKGGEIAGKTHAVVTSGGEKVDVQFALVEKNRLITSHDDALKENPAFPAELQPRDRTRAASEAQIAKIAKNLDPDQLGRSAKSSDGAPIVGPDMVVESGNARTLALRKAYQENPKGIKAYKEYLRQKAEKFGFRPEDVDSLKEPVLVRVRKTETDRVKFAQDSNVSDVAAMGAVEQARVDAGRLSDDLLDSFNPSEEGDILARQNQGFLKGFMDKVVGNAEQGRYLDADGNLSQDGVNRIKRAIFAKAYGEGKNTSALERMAESTDDNIKTISNALLAKSPAVVRFKAAMAKGEREALDLSDDLVAAANQMAEIRAKGEKVEEFLSQTRLLGDNLTPFQKEILRFFEANKRSAKKIGATIDEYYQLADAQGDPQQGKLLAGAKASKEELFQQAIKQAETGGQGSLFEQGKPVKRPVEGGFVRVGGRAQSKSLTAKLEKNKASLIGSTRKEPGLLAEMKENLAEKFSYMRGVRNKTFDIGGKTVEGNKFVAQVDRLQGWIRKNYDDSAAKVREAISALEDERGYTAREKLDDVTQYLLYADYISRAKEGMPVPGGVSLSDLVKNYNEAQKFIRSKPELRETVLKVRRLLTDLGDDLIRAGVIEKRRRQYFPHQVLEHIQDTFGLPVKVRKYTPGFAKQAKGSTKEIETDLVAALDAHLKAAGRLNAINRFIDGVVKDFAEPTWKLGQALPEGFVEWQPRQGNVYFEVIMVPEKALLDSATHYKMGEVFQAARKFDDATTSYEASAYAVLDKARRGLGVGGKRKTYAVPREIAQYLEKMYDPKYLEGRIDALTQAWKVVVTNSPINPAVYAFNLKNTIGDLENALRDDPALMQYVARARQEIIQARKGNPSKDFLSAEEWGVIGAGYYGSELQLSKIDFDVKRRFPKGIKDRVLYRSALGPFTKVYKNWEAFVEQGDLRNPLGILGTAREDWLRYAKFLRDKDLGLKPWQAAIENGRTFVNYNHLTPFEKNVFRASLLPFYTFYKHNAVNWAESLLGRRGKGTALRAWGLAAGVPMLTAAWNYMTDPDYEELLQSRRTKRYMVNMPHVNTGLKDQNGNSIYIVFPTASNAALQLFGMNRLPDHLASIATKVGSGKMELTEALKSQFGRALQEDIFTGIGKDDSFTVPRPAAEALELVNPFIKEGVEQLFDYDLFMGKQITRGEYGSEAENNWERLTHATRVAAPPYTRLEQVFNGKGDWKIKAISLFTAIVKAPDTYSWSDLADDEKKLEQAKRTIKDPELKQYYEAAKQALFEEKSRAVYDFRVNGKRYGEALNADQRMRVDTLLKSSKMGSGLSYSANSKMGLMALIKSIDSAQASAAPRDKLKLTMLKRAIPRYLQLLQEAEERRVKAAVQAVRMTGNPKLQGKIYKSLTGGGKDVAIPGLSYIRKKTEPKAIAASGRSSR